MIRIVNELGLGPLYTLRETTSMQPGQNKNNPGENNDERRKNEGNFHERRINQNNGFHNTLSSLKFYTSSGKHNNKDTAVAYCRHKYNLRRQTEDYCC